MLSRAIAGLIDTLSHVRHPGGILGLILVLALATPSAADDVHDRWGQVSSDAIFTAAQDDGDEDDSGAAPSVATTPAGRAASRIAFDSTRSGNVEIYVMNMDGSGVTNLTNHPAEDAEPAWSPDGTMIAFESDRAGNFDILVMNADGSDWVNLTDDPSMDLSPAWSPDGTRIAFASDRTDDFEIYVMNADGSDVTQLTNRPGVDGAPDWSPDGTRIAFESFRNGNFAIYVMNADGSNLRGLTSDAESSHRAPAWSPDGTRIAFHSYRPGGHDILGGHDVYVMNADGSRVINLTNYPWADDDAPQWSPDGRRIVFEANRLGNADVYIMNADGSGVTILTTDGATDSHPVISPR